MEIIKAEFNWISLLIVGGSILIGLINANNKKKNTPKPTPLHPEYNEDDQEENIVGDYTSTMKEETEKIIEKEHTFGDYYQPIMKNRKGTTYSEEEKNESSTTEEELNHNSGIDLRQAVIFSEILKRPQY